MAQIKDEELRAYADEIGHEEYRRNYQRLMNYALHNQDVRFSRTKNKTIDLDKIREKYKNGITPEIMKELAVNLFGEA